MKEREYSVTKLQNSDCHQNNDIIKAASKTHDIIMLVYIQLFINIYNCLCIAYTDI